MARINWTDITNELQWHEALALSHEQTVVVFKHSTRCPVSAMALRLLERDWDIEDAQAKPYFLDLIAYRQISNLIAEETQVEHESPQVIVLRNGKATHNASHQNISSETIKNIVK